MIDPIGAVTGHGKANGMAAGSSSVRLDQARLNWLLRIVFTERPDEIGCDECFEVVDTFAKLRLAGRDAAQAMPLVQDHLERCPPCREEFEALLDALRAVSRSD